MTDVQSRSIQLPSAFFKSAKREYKDWRFAMIREFIQNSYDAGATTIVFAVSESERGNTCIAVTDDGSGMDEDTLLNVLLCMGGSRKPEGAVGGFGYAKTILLLAHHAYSIRTDTGEGSTHVVEGAGGAYQYRVEPAATGCRGTTIQLEVDDHEGVEDWSERILEYARLCCMEYFTGRAVRIVLDGVELQQNNDTEYECQVDSPVGTFWFNEQGDTDSKVSTFVVHVQGLPMFFENVYGATSRIQVTGGIELAKGSAALTSNRDSLTGEYHQQFRECLAEVVGKQSELKYGNAVSVLLNASRADLSANGSARPASPAGVSLSRAQPVGDADGDGEGYADIVRRMDQSRFPVDFHIKVESLSRRRSSGSEAYVTTSVLLGELGKLRVAKYAHAWRAAVWTVLSARHCLECGVTFRSESGAAAVVKDLERMSAGELAAMVPYLDGLRIDSGFCFIEHVEGLCVQSFSGPVQILCNPWLIPTADESVLRYAWMLDLAIHEVAHLWKTEHNEEFVGLLDQIRQSLRRRLREAESIARVSGAVRARFQSMGGTDGDAILLETAEADGGA